MKRICIIMAIICLVFSCQKQSTDSTTSLSYLEVLKSDLQPRISTDDFNNLDFSQALLSRGDSGRLLFLQVPFNNTKVSNEVILLKTDAAGHIEKGKIIQLTSTMSGNRSATRPDNTFQGEITIQSLTRQVEVSSPIKSGFIQALRLRDSTSRASSTPDPYVELPEVVIVSTYSPSGNMNVSIYYSVLSMVSPGNSPVRGEGWYASAGGIGSGGGGTGASGGGFGSGAGGGSTGTGTGGTKPVKTIGGTSSVPTEEMIYIRPETEVYNSAIAVDSYVRCFSLIPDAGATCKITIFTDLPVNGDPTKFFNWDTESPGHSWIRFEKNNGSQHASQHIGFYPDKGWKTITTTAPIPGKWVNNGGHEFNASYELTITPAQLQSGLTQVQYLARVKQYDIDEYNCTDWALDIFNQVVTPAQKLFIQKVDIPGGKAPFGTNTPQGLFIKLRSMLNDDNPSVVIPLVGYAGISTGPCK